jgi:hypothetical protein
VIKNLSEPEKAAARMSERVGRAIVNHLKKANKQLAAHEKTFPRKNQVRLVTLVNEDNKIYDPKTVCRVITNVLWRIENGQPLYRHIDAVLFATERHATVINGDVTFPFLIVTGKPVLEAPWKHAVLDYVLDQWAAFSGIPLIKNPPKPYSFSTIEHVPRKMPRHDLWRLNYRRKPYMQFWPNDEIRDRWDEIHIRSLLAFHKESPMEFNRQILAANSEMHTHLMEEVAERGIPLQFFRPTLTRMRDAAKRIKAPAVAQSWIETVLKDLPKQ